MDHKNKKESLKVRIKLTEDDMKYLRFLAKPGCPTCKGKGFLEKGDVIEFCSCVMEVF